MNAKDGCDDCRCVRQVPVWSWAKKDLSFILLVVAAISSPISFRNMDEMKRRNAKFSQRQQQPVYRWHSVPPLVRRERLLIELDRWFFDFRRSVVQLGRSVLLLSLQDALAIVLLCHGRCTGGAIDQSIRQWTRHSIQYRLFSPVVVVWNDTFYSSRHSWGKEERRSEYWQLKKRTCFRACGEHFSSRPTSGGAVSEKTLALDNTPFSR